MQILNEDNLEEGAQMEDALLATGSGRSHPARPPVSGAQRGALAGLQNSNVLGQAHCQGPESQK